MGIQEIVINYFRQGKSQRAIARELNVHSRTVKKYTELHLQNLLNGKGQLVNSSYNPTARKKAKMTEAVASRIDALLKLNEQRICQGLYKQQLNGKTIQSQFSKNHKQHRGKQALP